MNRKSSLQSKEMLARSIANSLQILTTTEAEAVLAILGIKLTFGHPSSIAGVPTHEVEKTIKERTGAKELVGIATLNARQATGKGSQGEGVDIDKVHGEIPNSSTSSSS